LQKIFLTILLIIQIHEHDLNIGGIRWREQRSQIDEIEPLGKDQLSYSSKMSGKLVSIDWATYQ